MSSIEVDSIQGLLSSIAISGGDVASSGVEVSGFSSVIIGVLLGAIIGCIVVHVMRNHTSISSSLSKFFDNKNNIYSNKTMGNSQSQNTAKSEPTKQPSYLARRDVKSRPTPRAPPQPQAPRVETREPHGPKAAPEPKAHPVNLSRASFPQPMKSNGSLTLAQAREGSRLSSHDAPEPPKLPDLGRATALAEQTGTTTFLSTNKALIDAASSNTLRQKMNSASMGLTPVNDRIELPYKTQVKDQQMYQDIIQRRYAQLKESGSNMPFAMPQGFGMGDFAQAGENKELGSNLLLD